MTEANGFTEVGKKNGVKPSRSMLMRIVRLWMLCVGVCFAVVVSCSTIGTLMYRDRNSVWISGSPWSRDLNLPWYHLVSLRAMDVEMALFAYPMAYAALCVPMIFLGGWVIGDLPDGASLPKKVGVWAFLFVPPLLVEVLYLLWYHRML